MHNFAEGCGLRDAADVLADAMLLAGVTLIVLGGLVALWPRTQNITPHDMQNISTGLLWKSLRLLFDFERHSGLR